MFPFWKISLHLKTNSAILIRKRIFTQSAMVQKQENGNAMNEEPLSSLISTRDMSDQDESDEVPSDDDSSFEQSIESDSQHQRYANDFYRQY